MNRVDQALSEPVVRTVSWWAEAPVSEAKIKAAINHLDDAAVVCGVIINGHDDCIPALEVPVSYDVTLAPGLFILLLD